RDPEFSARAVAGSEALVHLAPLLTNAAPLEALERAARGTYVLMQAAHAAGIRRVVTGSALALFDHLPASWRISEAWRPRPKAVPEELAHWLAELSTREFARGLLAAPVICLRLGTIADALPAGSAGRNWLHPEDALGAVRRALEFEPAPRGWQVYH